jgi:hypothetical protein
MPALPNLHILFIEGGLPSPRVDAGSLANLELIALIQSQGHRVTYLFTGYNPLGSSKELTELGCMPINGVGLMRDQQVALLKEYAIDAAILSRPGPALQWIDALKVDVEGAEDVVLEPFFREAPPALWPRLILCARSDTGWSVDLPRMLSSYGYRETLRSRSNLGWERV